MYRVQISGGSYAPNQEIGLHYQIHRGIGVHHAAALQRGEPLRVNIFVGGTPAMSVAAVMPLPEGLSELGFAGALAGHRIPMIPSMTQGAARRPFMPRPTFASSDRSNRAARCPKARLAITWDITAWRTNIR